MSWVFLSEAGELDHQALEKYDGFMMNSLRYTRWNSSKNERFSGFCLDKQMDPFLWINKNYLSYF